MVITTNIVAIPTIGRISDGMMTTSCLAIIDHTAIIGARKNTIAMMTPTAIRTIATTRIIITVDLRRILKDDMTTTIIIIEEGAIQSSEQSSEESNTICPVLRAIGFVKRSNKNLLPLPLPPIERDHRHRQQQVQVQRRLKKVEIQ
jgi:hypothetical protein